jgi:hypothetical protein
LAEKKAAKTAQQQRLADEGRRLLALPLETAREEQKGLKKTYSTCLFSEYRMCTAGVLLGMPLSIKRRSYWPFVVGGLVGSAADLAISTEKCRDDWQRLKEMNAHIASLEAGAGTRASAT